MEVSFQQMRTKMLTQPPLWVLLCILYWNVYISSVCYGQLSSTTCSDDLCQNEGHCLEYGRHYVCVCNHGFGGGHCEIDIDECASAPCQNNATCDDKINAYGCICQEGFMGENCEIVTCPHIQFEIEGGLLSWPTTKVNTLTESMERCSPVGDKQIGEAKAIRQCSLDEEIGHGVWMQPEIRPCALEKETELQTHEPIITEEEDDLTSVSPHFTGVPNGGVNPRPTIMTISTLPIYNTNAPINLAHKHTTSPAFDFNDVTRIGFALSAILYFGILLTKCVFRCFKLIKTDSLLSQIITSLLLLSLTISAGLDANFSKPICTIVTLLIYIFILNTLLWMAIEVFDIYSGTTKWVAEKNIWWYIKKYIVAWGIPLAGAGFLLLLGYDSNILATEICFIPKGKLLYFWLFFPAVMITLFIIICTIHVIFTVTRPGVESIFASHAEMNQTIQRIQNAVIALFCLTISWISAVIAFLNPAIGFQITFCVLNSIQCMILFWVVCLRHERISVLWKQYSERRRCCRVSTYQVNPGGKDGSDTPDGALVVSVSYSSANEIYPLHNVTFNI